jgi:hypothetical protein
MITKPKSEGGLGVINIEIQNRALLLKNLDKFYNKKDIPWVNLVWEKQYKNGKLPDHTRKGSFWWRDILKLVNQFKEMTKIQLKDGKSCLFWKDDWYNGNLKTQCPEGFSFAKNGSISVNKAHNSESIFDLFNLPLSEAAYNQVLNIQQTLQAMVLNDESDVWTLNRGAKFSSAAAYKRLIGHHDTDQVYKWVWRSSCQPKHKVFAWLLLKDRLSTRNILRRKNMNLDNYNCEGCNMNVEETVEHLFLHCPFAQACWGILQLEVSPSAGIFENFNMFKIQLNSRFFMEAIVLIS